MKGKIFPLKKINVNFRNLGHCIEIKNFMDYLENAYQTGIQLNEHITNVFKDRVNIIYDAENIEFRDTINTVFSFIGMISQYEFQHLVGIFSKDSLLVYKQKIQSGCFNNDFKNLFYVSSMNIANYIVNNVKQLFMNFKFDNPSTIMNFFTSFSSTDSGVINKSQFKKNFHDTIKYFYIGKIDHCFSKAIVGLLRLDSSNLLMLYDIGNIYRRISDSLNYPFSEFSSIGPLLTKVGASLHASISVFINVFLLDLMDNKQYTINRIIEGKNSIRSYEVSSELINQKVLIDFYRKNASNGVNKGCIIVFQSPNLTKWYMKTFHLAFVSVPKDNTQEYSKKYQQITISSLRIFEPPNLENSISNFRTNLLTGTALELINSTFFDLREPLIYILLEYLGLGPQTIFFMNLCVFGGFYILTKELQNFRTILSEFNASEVVDGLDGILNSETLSYNEKLAIVETSILIEILMLEDINGNNFGFINENNTRSLLSIIDFVPPKQDFLPVFPSDIDENKKKIDKFNEMYFEEAPLSNSRIIRRDNCIPLIREGFLRLKSRIQTLTKPCIRLYSYPSSNNKHMTCSQFTEEYVHSGETIVFSEFLKSVSEQIFYHIFESESKIDGKTRKNSEMLGFIDGFLDTERNLSNPKRYAECAKEILRNYINIVLFRFEKYERMLINGTL